MGTLQKRANAYKKITNSVLLGSLEGDEFTDVEIVTLSQYARDCAYSAVLEGQFYVSSYEDIQVEVATLLSTTFNSAQEFVLIEKERIIIGLDVERVDDLAVDKALLHLAEVEDFSMGNHYVFGDPIEINAKP